MRHNALCATFILALLGVRPAAAAAPNSYALGPGTTVTYTLVHPAHTVVGKSTALRGDIQVAQGKALLPATFTLPWRSFQSGNANRDANALSAVMAARFPTALLTLTGYRLLSEKAEGPILAVQAEAHGSLKLRGVTKALRLAITAQVGPEQLVFDANTTLSLAAYGIPAPQLLFVPTEDAVKLEVHGVATRK